MFSLTALMEQRSKPIETEGQCTRQSGTAEDRHAGKRTADSRLDVSVSRIAGRKKGNEVGERGNEFTSPDVAAIENLEHPLLAKLGRPTL